MSVKLANHFLFWILLTSSTLLTAAGLDDADKRLFKVQLALAEKGDSRAQYYLGEMHEQGLGTRQNLNEAFKWYAKAAEQGNTWAKRKLAHRTEIEAELTKEQAVETLKSLSTPPEKSVKPESTAKKADKAKAPAMVVQADQSAQEEEKMRVQREKRRAAIRAMILERMRNPVGDPFE